MAWRLDLVKFEFYGVMASLATLVVVSNEHAA